MLNILGQQYPAVVFPALSENDFWIRVRRLQCCTEHPVALGHIGTGGRDWRKITPKPCLNSKINGNQCSGPSDSFHIGFRLRCSVLEVSYTI